MEYIQGSSIARCYGCYELKLETGWRVNPWEDASHVAYDDSLDTCPDFKRYPAIAAREAEILPHPLLRDLVYTTDRVFVILLEKLGCEISGGYQYAESVQ